MGRASHHVEIFLLILWCLCTRCIAADIRVVEPHTFPWAHATDDTITMRRGHAFDVMDGDNTPDSIATRLRADVFVRAVYPLTTSYTRTNGSKLESAGYQLCTAISDKKLPTSAWCSTVASTPGTVLQVEQSIKWSTLLAPGLTSRKDYNATVEDVSLACCTYGCDMMEYDPVSVDQASSMPPAYGGLGPASPCCSSTNSTFILFNQATVEESFMIQTDAFPLKTAYTIAQDWAAPAPITQCLIRVLPSVLYNPRTIQSNWFSDGGVVFPATFNICNRSISEAFSQVNAQLLSSRYLVLLTTATHVGGLALPMELIKAITSWIMPVVTNPPRSASMWNAKSCHWATDSNDAGFYRTGRSWRCQLHPSMIGQLPTLFLNVQSGSLIPNATSDGEWTDHVPLADPCMLPLDLNRLVTSSGMLVLHSTGSIANSLHSASGALHYQEPLVVMGAAFIDHSIIAFTRRVTPSTSAAVPHPLLQLPALYIAAPLTGPNITFDDESGRNPACASATACELQEMFFEAINQCGEPSCAGVYAYNFIGPTMSCTPKSTIYALFAVLFIILALVECGVLYLRPRAEGAVLRHMRFIECITAEEE